MMHRYLPQLEGNPWEYPLQRLLDQLLSLCVSQYSGGRFFPVFNCTPPYVGFDRLFRALK